MSVDSYGSSEGDGSSNVTSDRHRSVDHSYDDLPVAPASRVELEARFVLLDCSYFVLA